VKLLGKQLDSVDEDAMLQLAIQSVFGSKKEEKATDRSGNK
jgi:hypothetical protein